MDEKTTAYTVRAIPAPGQDVGGGPEARPGGRAGGLEDIVLVWPGREWRLLGRRGAEAELELADRAVADPETLPVFIGAGLGLGIERYLELTDRPCAVLDREEAIEAATGVRERLRGERRVFWVSTPDADSAMTAITRWQLANDGRPASPHALPVYLRLDPMFYGAVNKRLQDHGRLDVLRDLRYPKFKGAARRVLLLDPNIHLVFQEATESLASLGVETRILRLYDYPDVPSFIEDFLRTVRDFRPDFALTVNHFGVDAKGALVDLLDTLRLPLASWFIDNPEFILHRYDYLASPWVAVFATAHEALAPVRSRGYEHVAYLPLATDPGRFAPVKDTQPASHPWRARVSFVGSTWLKSIQEKLHAGRFPRPLLRAYRPLAERISRAGTGAGGGLMPSALLAAEAPDLHAVWRGLGSVERQRDFDLLVIWEANRRYRVRCVERLLPFSPLIVGDPGWKTVLRRAPGAWRRLDGLNYYRDLPRFYPLQAVSFNCTSVHMRGALNQRNFDVPACGAFLLTDWHPRIEEHFEVGREVVCYRDPDDVPGLLERWLADGPGRRAVATAGRKRVLAEHTYAHRLRSLLAEMARIYA